MILKVIITRFRNALSGKGGGKKPIGFFLIAELSCASAKLGVTWWGEENWKKTLFERRFIHYDFITRCWQIVRFTRHVERASVAQLIAHRSVELKTFWGSRVRIPVKRRKSIYARSPPSPSLLLMIEWRQPIRSVCPLSRSLPYLSG